MLLGQAEQLRHAGRLQESEQLCQRVLAVDPNNSACHQILSLLALKVGKLPLAAELMAKAVQFDPEVATYRRNLCEMYRRLGQLDQAAAQGRRATELAPEDAEAFYNLGVTLDDAKDLAGALDAYQQAVSLNPKHNLSWNNLGSALGRLGNEAKSLEAYLKAAEINPQHAEAQNNIAAIYLDQGKLDEARDRLKKSIGAKPDFLEAHQNLSTLIQYTTDNPHYLYLEEQLVKREGLNSEQRIRMLFAVGKAREDVGQPQLAMLAYREANRLKRDTLNYDEKHGEVLCKVLTEPFTENSFTIATVEASTDQTPVFIVGMPRSGTTLIEQVLCSHPEIHGAGELKDFQQVLSAHPAVGPMNEAATWVPKLTDKDYQDIGQAYLQRLREYHGTAARITDKMPGNFHYLGFICRALPGTRVIHSMRNPMDSCISNYTRLFNDTMEFSYNLEELGRYYNRYVELMQYWDRVLPAGVVLHMPYEAMVNDVETEARRLISHVGLAWDDACLKFYENRRPVRTASVAQVRRPIYKTSVARWVSYGELVNPLREIVGEDYPHGFTDVPSSSTLPSG